jgi:tRNA-dihydrouridine synthase
MQDALNHCAQSNIAGIMAGRWLLRSPLDLLKVDEAFYGQTSSTSLDAVCNQYVEYALRSLEHGDGSLRELVLPLALICYELEEKARTAASNCDVEGEARAISDAEVLLKASSPLLTKHQGVKSAFEYDGTGSCFRVWKSSLEKVCGKKVINKHKRNRAESAR